MIGYYQWLGIFDLQKHQTLKNIEFMEDDICSIAFSRDNQSAWVSGFNGYIKMIKWQTGASSGDDFDFADKVERVGAGGTNSICLTKDEKYLLVGSSKAMSVFEIETTRVIRKIKHAYIVKAITLIKDGKDAVVAERNGSMYAIDLETLNIYPIAKNITKNKYLTSIAII